MEIQTNYLSIYTVEFDRKLINFSYCLIENYYIYLPIYTVVMDSQSIYLSVYRNEIECLNNYLSIYTFFNYSHYFYLSHFVLWWRINTIICPFVPMGLTVSIFICLLMELWWNSNKFSQFIDLCSKFILFICLIIDLWWAINQMVWVIL